MTSSGLRNRSGSLDQRARARRSPSTARSSASACALALDDAGERRLGHGQEHRGTSSSTMMATSISRSVAANSRGQHHGCSWRKPSGAAPCQWKRFEQLALAAPHRARPRPARRGRGRARAGCRARPAARARRRSVPACSGAWRAATAGQITTSPSSSGRSLGSAGGRSGPVRDPASAATSTSTSVASIGKASTSVGPSSPRNCSLSSAMSSSSTNSSAQLGVAAHALGGEHRLGQRAPTGPRRPARATCSSATNTSGSPVAAEPFCGPPQTRPRRLTHARFPSPARS